MKGVYRGIEVRLASHVELVAKQLTEEDNTIARNSVSCHDRTQPSVSLRILGLS